MGDCYERGRVFGNKRPFPEAEGVQPAERKRKTLAKADIHGQRYVERMFRKALENKKVLPFRMSEFQRALNKGKVILNADPINKPTVKPCVPVLSEETTVLAADGPQLFVDLDDCFVLLYNPDFIPPKLSQRLYESIKGMVGAKPPPKDPTKGEKRSRGEAEGADTLPGGSAKGKELSQEKVTAEDVEEDTVVGDAIYKLPPSAYHFSPGWYGTAQEKRTDREVVPSADLKAFLDSGARKKYLEYLSCTQEVNHQIRHLVDMLNPALGNRLQQLHSRVANLDSPSSEVLRSCWNSPYMCQAIAFNRKTAIHRDSKGFMNNLDTMYLLGDFKPGHLKLQDLNMSIEWGPRNLCVFDGYTFAHEASDCGRGRVCCISFCRSSTFRGLEVPMRIPLPSAGNIPQSLRRNVS